MNISTFQVRVENIRNPEFHIPTVLERVKKEYIARTYKVGEWQDADDFLEKVAYKCGRLLKVIATWMYMHECLCIYTHTHILLLLLYNILYSTLYNWTKITLKRFTDKRSN